MLFYRYHFEFTPNIYASGEQVYNLQIFAKIELASLFYLISYFVEKYLELLKIVSANFILSQVKENFNFCVIYKDILVFSNFQFV